MTTDIPEPTSTLPPPAVPAKNVFERFVGVLFAPTETFQDIVRKPDVLAPLILLLVIGYIGTFVVMPFMDWDSLITQQTEQMRKQNPNMSDADIERATGMIKGFGKVFGYFGPILGVIGWVVIAGVLFLAFRLFGGQGTFKQAFSITLYAWVPLTIFGIVMAIVVFSQHTFDPTRAAIIVKSNPAFLTDLKEHPVLFSFLSSFDVFSLWSLVLFIIGFSVMSGFSRAKSALIVVALWLALIVGVMKVGLPALGAMRAK